MTWSDMLLMLSIWFLLALVAAAAYSVLRWVSTR